ncbi:MAG: hypothetical protein L0H64_18700 [Pseudonocardia sp.]|nr:hypothetical protein [Pseudonocardia sp.]
MWDAPVITVGGLPLQPLVIHAVVVLLPLAALGTSRCSSWCCSGATAAVGVAVTGLVVWIGHAGATAVWQGVL